MYRLANVRPDSGQLFETREDAERWLSDHEYVRLDYPSWTVDDGEAYPYACADDLDLDKPFEECDTEEILEMYGHGYEPVLVEIEN